MTKEDQYKDAFGIGSTQPQQKTAAALDHALDIRKFEIGLYWQRTTYFWTLIAAVFAGYFVVLSADFPKAKDKEFNTYVLACVGFIFSFAWFLTNKGSKFWQENWENHVDMLEDGIIGPLYKTVLSRPKEKNFCPLAVVVAPAPFSVSRINQWVSFFITAIWLVLVIVNRPGPATLDSFSLASQQSWVEAITLIVALLLWFNSKSNIEGGYWHSMSLKRTTVIDD